MAKKSLDELLRRQERKTPNNPWATPADGPSRITYRDDTGNTAVANVMREQRGKQ